MLHILSFVTCFQSWHRNVTASFWISTDLFNKRFIAFKVIFHDAKLQSCSLFAGLIVAYFCYRLHYPSLFDDAGMQTFQNMNYFLRAIYNMRWTYKWLYTYWCRPMLMQRPKMWTLTFEWRVVTCGSKNGYQEEIFKKKKIGLCAQNLLPILGSTGNVIGGAYMVNLWAQESLLW